MDLKTGVTALLTIHFHRLQLGFSGKFYDKLMCANLTWRVGFRNLAGLGERGQVCQSWLICKFKLVSDYFVHPYTCTNQFLIFVPYAHRLKKNNCIFDGANNVLHGVCHAARARRRFTKEKWARGGDKKEQEGIVCTLSEPLVCLGLTNGGMRLRAWFFM